MWSEIHSYVSDYISLNVNLDLEWVSNYSI